MLMTALSAGAGPIPEAILHGIGGQAQLPLATKVIDGISVDPLLLWVVAPALRRIFLSHDTSAASASEPTAGGRAVVTEGGDRAGIWWGWG
jgi:cobalt-zinc-cadmium resistance protein CzcA